MHVRKTNHVNMVAEFHMHVDIPTCWTFSHVENFLHVASFFAFCKSLHVPDVRPLAGCSTPESEVIVEVSLAHPYNADSAGLARTPAGKRVVMRILCAGDALDPPLWSGRT